jgi:hypothetical protein
MEFLQGGTADFEGPSLTKANGQINRDTQDSLAISLLYGTLLEICHYDETEAIEIATATFSHYCKEHPEMDDGQKRRWPNDTDEYRDRVTQYALNSFSPEPFEAFVDTNHRSERRRNNEYSEQTYDAIWTAIDDLLPDYPPILSNDMDPGSETSDGLMVGETPVHELYPSKNEVIERAYEVDDGYNSKNSYEEAFRRLQATYGEVKAARIGSSTWVYYPSNYPDPPEAFSVTQYGEKYDPEIANGINSWTGEPE